MGKRAKAPAASPPAEAAARSSADRCEAWGCTCEDAAKRWYLKAVGYFIIFGVGEVLIAPKSGWLAWSYPRFGIAAGWLTLWLMLARHALAQHDRQAEQAQRSRAAAVKLRAMFEANRERSKDPDRLIEAISTMPLCPLAISPVVIHESVLDPTAER